MPARVTLTVIEGSLKGQQFVFSERTTCVLGREKDCCPRLPDDPAHRKISRHHCLLDINPPDVRVRDFGSLNGTYVNGSKIGQRPRGHTPADVPALSLPEYDLDDGDAIKLGDTVLRVSIFVPIVCTACGNEVPEEDTAQAEVSPGVQRCAACRVQFQETLYPPPPETSASRSCARCRRDVAQEIGERRHGEFVCAACRDKPAEILRRLMDMARTGKREVLAIQGYEVVREIGRGGMGAVFLARHEQTGEVVALKLMLPRVALDERAKRLFLRELETTRALNHPNVVRLRDGGCTEGTFFLTLEYCDGGTVDGLIRQRGSLPVPEAVDIVLQALTGLDYAHNVELSVKLKDGSTKQARGLVHRDLKPQNLFLSNSAGARVVKVGDYGLAKAFDLAGLSGLSCTSETAGTPVFMPRQQVIDYLYAKPEVDVWAMAATLYVMLTGQPPRDFVKGKDPWQVVLQSDALPILKRNATLPRRLAEIIDTALIDRPEIHFKTAAEFRRALENAV